MPRLRISLFASFLAVLSGVLTIVLWSIGLRWVAFLLLFWVTVAGFGLLRWFDVQVEKLMLYTFVLANSIRMDVHVVFSKSGFGFPIGLGEVSLVALLIRAEELNGFPLTRNQAIAIRDNAFCTMLPPATKAEIDEERGYLDIDPERCWEDWLIVRARMLPH